MPNNRKIQRSGLTALLGVGASLLISLSARQANAQISSTLFGRVLDSQGLGVPGANLHIRSQGTGLDRYAGSDSTGSYRAPALLPGAYEITASKPGFATKNLNGIEIVVNSSLNLDISLNVAAVESALTVDADAPLLNTGNSFFGAVITPSQINNMPLNGRNYLDLLQLVPGVALNRQADPGADSATPILGERSGNAQFLVDGLPNSDEVNGGAAAQFNQESILEFQVMTSGYKAEFGHASGGVINVASKSGTNDLHGAVSLFHRNYELDSANIAGQKRAPFLLRWDPSGQFGGPLVKDRAFFFISAERIVENRDLNFQFPPNEPSTLIAFESPFNQHTTTFDTRLRAKLDQQFGRHRLSEQMNLTNMHVKDFLPLSQSMKLPSTRTNTDARHLMVGVSDIALIGEGANPFVLNVYGQYRGEPMRIYPSHSEAGAASTVFNLFDTYNSDQVVGNLGQVVFGPGFTPFNLDQKYASLGGSVARQNGRHAWKTGWDFQRTLADGVESSNVSNQLFATISDFNQFGPIDSGIGLMTYQGGATPQDRGIYLRNNHQGLYAQDDWKVAPRLTVNYGLRWDYDSGFPNRLNVSPRLGVAWSLNSKTVLRAGWGIFFDHFRVGTGRDVPELGGANVTKTRYLSFPRLFYGNPSQVAQNFGARGTGVPCISNTLTDQQVAQQNPACLLGKQAIPLRVYGIDHLSKVVAPGRAPIPAGAVVNSSNIEQFSGMPPQQFADAASSSIGQQPGFFTWDPFGHLSTTAVSAAGDRVPVTVDPSFRTPYTSSIQLGIERELSRGLVVEANFYHRDIYNILGVRNTNLAFVARIRGHTGQLEPGTGKDIILGYGPWYAGTYNAVSVSVMKRLGARFSLDASYTFAHATDDAVPNLITEQQLGTGLSSAAGVNGPVDSFVGVPPVVTDPVSGKSNASGPFIASNGSPVPKAGEFYNGPALTSGPSDLAVDHTFLVSGICNLPRGFSISGIFRGQSGFHYSASSLVPPDVDGDGLLNAIDYTKGRNRFTAPPFVNTDLRAAKLFKFGDVVRFHLYLEFFNVFNNANPAAIETFPNIASQAFGSTLQVLPGREGQLGARFEF